MSRSQSKTNKNQSQTQAAPSNNPQQKESWYEAIYDQWQARESCCTMYDRPMLEELKHRRHYPHANRSQLRFETPRHPMTFSMSDRSRGVYFPPERRCFPVKKTCSQLSQYF